INKRRIFMNMTQLERMKNDNGFIAALDQSGGSTPKALAMYGITEEAYADEAEMFQLVHEMRSRIMKSTAFTKERILAAILFEKTMDLKVNGKYTADYLWETKGILSILKVDRGLMDLNNGVQLMKLIPILEPEVDIHTPNKEMAEFILRKEILEQLKTLDVNCQIMFKLTIPSVDNYYEEIIKHPNIVRVVALSGGYSRKEANEKLARNQKLIASFSRALTEGLNVNQSDSEFDDMLDKSIQSIYDASIT